MRWSVVRAVIGLAWREYARAPAAIFWSYGFPLVMALVLGLAFGEREPAPLRIAVEPGSELRVALEQWGGPRLIVEPLARDDAYQRLVLGGIDMIVGGSRSVPEFEYDPKRPSAELARLLVDRALAADVGFHPPEAEVHEVDEPGDRYIDFLIAGLIGLNLLGAGVYGVGYNIVSMRSKSIMRRMAVTPIRRREFLFGFLFARGILAIPAPCIIALFGMSAFGVPIRGSLLEMMLLCGVGAFAFLGLGLLVSSRSRTIEGVSGLMNLVMMPSWLLGGALFSNERFPAFAQPLVEAIPLTHMTRGLRAVMLGSGDANAVWWAIAILAAVGAVCFACAVRAFRWT